MRDFAFEIIREGSGRPSRKKASDLSIDVPLPGFHEGIEDAPQNACALGDASPWSWLTKEPKSLLCAA